MEIIEKRTKTENIQNLGINSKLRKLYVNREQKHPI